VELCEELCGATVDCVAGGSCADPADCAEAKAGMDASTASANNFFMVISLS